MSSVENKKIKILIVGDFASPVHEPAVFGAFVSLGEEAHKFSTTSFFEGFLARSPKTFSDLSKFLYYRIQNKFSFGPVIAHINKSLIREAQEMHPDLVFVYRGTHIRPGTLSAIKKTGAVVFGYSNDDPFGESYPFYIWRNFKKSIFGYDHIFVYREKNIADYRALGYGNVSLLRSYYIKERNFPIPNLARNAYTADCTFVGHYEDDGREGYIKAIIDAGIDFQLHGPEWERSKYYELFKKKFGAIESLRDDYNLALNSAKIALVFLSRLNNDTYTRRCFEIPAAGTFMLAEYSDDLANMFEEDKEAAYFRSKEELIQKIKFYLEHGDLREKIAKAGFERLQRDGHEVGDRAKEIIRIYNIIKR